MSIGKVWNTLGPGFLYAGAAVGVSHLVQSTKAGAQYGFALLGIVLLTNVLKYPFFEAGPRYASATGENLIQGYQRIGKWAVWLFTLLTLSTAFIIQAAVTIVTAALLNNLFGLDLSPVASSIIILAVCSAVLLIGQYKLLDNAIKWVVVLLSVTSLIVFVKAFIEPTETNLWPNWINNETSFVFLIALMGWMPAPIDIATWHSIWTTEKRKKEKTLSVREALRDFHIGYWGTAILAMVFLSLGALVLYANNISLIGTSGAEFSNRFIGIYTETLGSWTYPIIAFAAFATMFSTTITVLDGAPRVGDALIPIIRGKKNKDNRMVYRIAIIVIAAGAALLIAQFAGKSVFSSLIKVATVASFITAPLLGFLNYKLIFSKHVPIEAQPPIFTKILAVFGIVFLAALALIYLAYLAKIVSI